MSLIAQFKPDIVFHAAALKHVPLLEKDWDEGIKTNVFGSINVADAAAAAGASAMVMISTDKAIEPVSVLGATKRLAEMYCQALDDELSHHGSGGRQTMRLISVRFGNVLASNGSVVPKFKAQIEAGGPVTVTHPDMVRYFMTIREACDLVVTAASHALDRANGDVSVYVLNMGQPVKIVDLAERIIRLSGLEPGRDIKIAFTGIRPGERLHEILFAREEETADIGIPGIVAAKPVRPSLEAIRAGLRHWSKVWRAANGRRSTTCCATRCLSFAAKPLEGIFKLDLAAFFKAEFAEHHDVARRTEAALLAPLPAWSALASSRSAAAASSMFFGNGGSASRCPASRDRVDHPLQDQTAAPIAAIALTTDTSALTAAGNDLGFERYLCPPDRGARPSPATSPSPSRRPAKAPNVIAALKQAKAMGLVTAALSGKGGGDLAGPCRPPAGGSLRYRRPHPGNAHNLGPNALRRPGDRARAGFRASVSGPSRRPTIWSRLNLILHR